jgi:hypothetical protein
MLINIQTVPSRSGEIVWRIQDLVRSNKLVYT